MDTSNTVEFVAWSLSYQEFRQPELTDALLLAAGKALYLANAFELKCKSVLRVMNLVHAVESDPVLNLEQAIAALPQDKLLGATVQDILSHPIGSDVTKSDLLHGARRARNFIAHEGMCTGPVWSLSRRSVLEQAALLRTAVADLITGDNVVSAWCYEIEEKQGTPHDFVAIYPGMAQRWVFGALDLLLAQTEASTIASRLCCKSSNAGEPLGEAPKRMTRRRAARRPREGPISAQSEWQGSVGSAAATSTDLRSSTMR